MKNIVLHIAIIMCTCLSISASDINILTTNNWWQKYAGYISNLEIEITPDNHYARVDLTFYVNVDSVNYNYNGYSHSLPSYRDQNLEAQLQFLLPKGSYFYDSYLWLNEHTIIRADLMERGKANFIYDSIVNRKSDPSILSKQLNDNYTLKIFPISTTFRRKIMLSYACPFISNSDSKEYLELPSDLLKLLNEDSKINLKINNSQNINFTSSLFPLNAKLISRSSKYQLIEILSKNLNISKNYLEFENTDASLVSFFYQISNPNEGFYDLRIKTSQLKNLTKKTTAFNISIPFETRFGFVFNVENNAQNFLTPNENYYETGEFLGSIQFNDSINLSYSINDSIYTHKQEIKSDNISKYIKQNWTNLYCNTHTNDESIRNGQLHRVLNTQNSFLALENGDTVSNAKNNAMRSGSFTTSGVNQLNSTSNFEIYPSPFIDKFTIKSSQMILNIKLITIEGKVLYNFSTNRLIKDLEINTTEFNLVSGIYFVQIETKSGIETIRIEKE